MISVLPKDLNVAVHSLVFILHNFTDPSELALFERERKSDIPSLAFTRYERDDMMTIGGENGAVHEGDVSTELFDHLSRFQSMNSSETKRVFRRRKQSSFDLTVRNGRTNHSTVECYPWKRLNSLHPSGEHHRISVGIDQFVLSTPDPNE